MRGAVLLALVATAACWPTTRIDREEEQARLTRLLPDGTPALRVSAVLDSLGIEHGAYDPTVHQMHAIDRNTARNGPIDTSIQIDLRFDSRGRLISRSLKEVHTGP